LSIQRKASELRLHFREIVNGFKVHDSLCANNPEMNISIQELHLIELLGDDGPLMMRELSERLLVAVNTITNIVDNLEKKHYVERLRSTEDRRVIRVMLTQEGKTIYQSFLKTHVHFCNQMLSSLNEDEQDILMLLMRKIARSAQGRGAVSSLNTNND